MSLRSVKEIYGYTIQTSDGEIGKVHEFLFDDEHWAIRYLMVETGNWLDGRSVLISAAALGTADWQAKTIHVNLTRKQVEESPDITTDQPVSRQHELVLANHYGYAPYWGGSGLWGSGMYPVGIWGAGVNAVGTNNLDSVPEMPNTPATIVAEAMQSEETQSEHGDPHLRSSREVAGYAIQALDEDIGHVDDFLVDDETWALQYVVVATRNWLPGKHVLVAPSWIRTISWEERAMHIDLTKEQIKSSPEYNPAQMLHNDDMEALHAHYDRPPHAEVDLHK